MTQGTECGERERFLGFAAAQTLVSTLRCTFTPSVTCFPKTKSNTKSR